MLIMNFLKVKINTVNDVEGVIYKYHVSLDEAHNALIKPKPTSNIKLYSYTELNGNS